MATPTQPYQLRVAMARDCLYLWPVVMVRSGGEEEEAVSSSEQLLGRLCQLMVSLLQDTDGDVREEMAKTVTELLSGRLKELEDKYRPLWGGGGELSYTFSSVNPLPLQEFDQL